jgi:hypothetical protein
MQRPKNAAFTGNGAKKKASLQDNALTRKTTKGSFTPI